MPSHSNLERFRVTKEELTKLGLEFEAEAFPLAEKLYRTTFWITLNKKSSKKIIKQTFIEAIEDCNVTKNEADWQSWIHRIWMREILDFYVKRENDIQTKLDFIDWTEVGDDEVSSIQINEDELKILLGKLPAVLRIPLILKEVHSLDYESIAELIDVPNGVIATRIYRARKLLFILIRNKIDYEQEKQKWIDKESTDKIFELRKSALFVDDEFSSERKSSLNESDKTHPQFETEIRIQKEIKLILKSCIDLSISIHRLKSKIDKRARKKFTAN